MALPSEEEDAEAAFQARDTTGGHFMSQTERSARAVSRYLPSSAIGKARLSRPRIGIGGARAAGSAIERRPIRLTRRRAVPRVERTCDRHSLAAGGVNAEVVLVGRRRLKVWGPPATFKILFRVPTRRCPPTRTEHGGGVAASSRTSEAESFWAPAGNANRARQATGTHTGPRVPSLARRWHSAVSWREAGSGVATPGRTRRISRRLSCRAARTLFLVFRMFGVWTESR